MIDLPPKYVDLTARCTNKDWEHNMRPWAEVTAITLHQTGCPMSEKTDRWIALKAHYGVTYSGQIYRIHPDEAFGWHAQGLSRHGIGIEIAGLFCGVEGDIKTRPGAPASWALQSITPAQVDACHHLIRYLKRLVQSHGSDLTRIHAHRQGAPKDDPRNGRKPDPGSKAWSLVALPMIAELGLSDGGVGWVSGRGEPLPDSWTGQPNGIPY